jgi:drug/metabolite transporter (DMT)-like permease
MLWIPASLGAATAQLVRNALQSALTPRVGTLGATMVRFLFALPFALLAYGAAVLVGHEPVPGLPARLIEWALVGAVTQIAATALMLRAMHLRGFAVAYAYIKTEPVLLALGGWLLLGDVLPLGAWLGIVIATAGVVWAALPNGQGLAALRGEAGPVALGVFGGALFGLSSLAFRAAILTLPGVPPWMASLHVMVFGLSVQTALMLAWLGVSDRGAIKAVFVAWRPSLAAGFAGMLATLMWFIGFALTPAANVRTLALIEMPVAALLNRRVSGRHLGLRQWSGMVLIALGIAVLTWAVV